MYIMTQKDHKRRHQKCNVHWLIPFLNLIVLLVTRTQCNECIADLSRQNACLKHLEKDANINN